MYKRQHLEIEAGRLAYNDRNLYVADMKHSDVPVDWLLSAEHATELRASINSDAAMQQFPALLPSHIKAQ